MSRSRYSDNCSVAHSKSFWFSCKEKIVPYILCHSSSKQATKMTSSKVMYFRLLLFVPHVNVHRYYYLKDDRLIILHKVESKDVSEHQSLATLT